MKLVPTASQTAGPFLHLGLTDKGSVGGMVGQTAIGELVRIRIYILDGDGAPVSDAVVEVWQADAQGRYRHPDDLRPTDCDPTWRGFSRLAVDRQGCCAFESVKPGRVPGRGNTVQAPHLNISIFARGLLKQLVTRMYFAGDKSNLADPVLALVPEGRRETLMAQPDNSHPGSWCFEIRLCGENETVFFDV
jgi:protocatechuate 3,4-dioxygenase, alpha subunit